MAVKSWYMLTSYVAALFTCLVHGVLGSLLLVDEPISTEQSGFGSSSDEQIPISRGDEVLFAGTTFGGGHPDVLHDGTVSGGSPCKSIFEVLVAERLDTSRAVLQAGLGRNFSMLLHPGAEVTLLAPSEAAFQLLGFNSSVLPKATVSKRLSETWVLQHPVNTAAAVTANVIAPSLDGNNVTLCAAVNETDVIVNDALMRIIKADIPACRSWVHVLDSVLGLRTT